MMRWMSALLCCAIPAFVLACGGGKNAKSADDAEIEDDRKWEDGPVKWDDSDQSDDSPREDSSSGSGKSHKPLPVPDDYELTPSDCEALGQNYRNVLYRSLKEKLDAAKLPEKQIAAQEAKIQKDTETGTGKWLDACFSVVNSVQVRSRLQCALDAKTLERFDGCWNGKFDDEASE